MHTQAMYKTGYVCAHTVFSVFTRDFLWLEIGEFSRCMVRRMTRSLLIDTWLLSTMSNGGRWIESRFNIMDCVIVQFVGK